MGKYIKGGTIEMYNPPVIKSYASAVGKKEGDGPLQEYFDYISEDATFGSGSQDKDSWEKSESRLQQKAFSLALRKGSLSENDIGIMFAGD
ncbi:MAG: stage V sporulation protein AD, partial [Oscillospiraceae bacterium]|nr:stage V sporulation protein AD [Oscillospiraceae bacterium]